MSTELALAALLGAALALVGLLGLCAQGLLPVVLSSVLLPLAFMAILASLHGLLPAADGRPLLRRHGFWLLSVEGVLGLPALGAHGLFDPWESHYGEVAREMLARHDAVSPFWAHEGLFTSKPALLFWMSAISMRALGLNPEPGRMLDGIGGRVAQPEWAVRAPIFVVAAVALYVLYKCLAPALGRRAAACGALLVASSSLWVLLSHQATTDMPLVAFLTAAMGLFFRAMTTDEGALLVVREVRLRGVMLRVHGAQLLAVALFALVAPQALYLISQNVGVHWEPGARGFSWHGDIVALGSAGNCALPGQVACGFVAPKHGLAPFVQGVLWLVVAAALAKVALAERRLSRCLALAGWLFAALATMAKGPAGLVLPLATAAVFALVSRRFSSLKALSPFRGLALSAAMILPWYVATWARHDRLFVDELVLRHMLGRTMEHLHDTNAGDDTSYRYYLAQLAFGLLPWTGLALLGLGRALRERASHAERFLAIWALLAFGLVTVMKTKFHHYVFPVVPPLAMLAGLSLAEARRTRSFGHVAMATAISVAAAASLVLPEGGAARLVHLFTYQYARVWPADVDVRAGLWLLAVATVAAPMGVLVSRRLRALLVVVSLGAALFSGTWLLAAAAPHWGQKKTMEAWARARRERDLPLVAYRLNWKGENFYAGNKLAIIGAGGSSDGVSLRSFVQRLEGAPARAFFVATERAQLSALKSELRGASMVELTSARHSHQFCLLRVVL